MEKLSGTVDGTEDELILITVAEACNLMKIGRNTMLKLVKTKGFPMIRYGNGPYLIDKKALPIWITKHYGNYKL